MPEGATESGGSTKATRAVMEVRIQIEDPRQSEVLALLADSDSYYAELYPAEKQSLARCFLPRCS
jgi:hypothetical protein